MKERRKRRSTKDIEESIINAATRFIETEGFSNLTVTSIMRQAEIEPVLHIPADTRSAFPVISVQSPVSIQCCWQS